MHFIEAPLATRYPLFAAALLTLMSGCAMRTSPSAGAEAVTATATAQPQRNTAQAATTAAAPATTTSPTPARTLPTTKPGTATTSLPPPTSSRNWDAYRLQAAHRMVAANPQGTYMGKAPDPLLAIPVLEVELNGDGSVRHIAVLRQPSQARDTVKLAMDAVHRAAPFGDVTRLPRPWKFAEVFLFDDDRRFKPRTLD